ncbi:MAG: glycosyltransferase family 2 protein [Candidatus Marinimicrobia bacterium]|nr:glycosyltransferase family 2 protein [Candidatus Neomarinimicrobiota bacterium]MCF7922895.1 glycosyltransferase family 2 protein [Candidatus Neomarinimicrobiota bacterium]
MNPVILIPVYNGRDSILRLIQEIKSVADYPIMIIDDGSTDGTGSGDFESVTYLRHDKNRGKGAALKTGLSQAEARGFDHAITLDADGQHDPGKISNFIAGAESHPRALVVGMRDLVNNSMPFHRKLSNHITSLVLSLRTSLRVRDSQVGYRSYPLNDSRLWDSIEDGFQFESAVFFNAAKLKIPLVWQPIPVIYGSEESHMNLFMDTLRFIRTFMRSFKC